MAPSPAEVVSLRFRIGELWREHLKDLARAVEAYRQVLTMDPAHEPTRARARGAHGRQRGRAAVLAAAGAGADLRERRRVGPRDRRLRGDAGAGRGGRRAGSSCSAGWRRSRSGGCRTRTPRSTSTGARCASIRPTRTCWGSSIGWRPRPGTGPSSATCSPRELEKIDDPRRQIDLLLRLGRVYEEETDQPEEAIATYRKAVEAEPENKQALVALDGLYGRAQQWDELAGDRAPRDRHRRLRRPAGRAHLPAGADLRAGARWTCRRPSRPTARSWSPTRRTPRRAPRSSGCSWAAPCRSRSPRCWSRSTARARSGRSCTRSTRCSSVA